jgi:hypothetical protein
MDEGYYSVSHEGSRELLNGSRDTRVGEWSLTGTSREFRRSDRLYHVQAEPSVVKARVRNLSSPLNHEYVIAWEILDSPPMTRISIRETDDLESQVLLGFKHPELGPQRGEDLINEVSGLLRSTENNSPDVKEAFRFVIRKTRDSYASEDDRRRIDILFGRTP